MRITLLILALIFCAAARAQKYSELFTQLPGMTADQQKQLLKNVLADDREHPNANFRLALLYERNYRTTNPLVSYTFALANAAEAKLYLNKAKTLCDAREVSRNNEQYWPLFKTLDAKGKPEVPFPLVAGKLQRAYDSADTFVKNMPPIYSAFTKSVNQYDQAVKLFAHLNSRFASMEDLYLLLDPPLQQELQQLKMHYDSCLTYLDQYLALTRAYPVLSYRHSYKVLPIQTYRLDGLTTSINFLVPEIKLWNYGDWVKQIQAYAGGPLADLRKGIDQTYEQIKRNLAALEVLPFGQRGAAEKLSKALVFNLNNTDRQSVVLPLLYYEAFRQEWLNEIKQQEPDTFPSRRNAVLFTNLIYLNRRADTLVSNLREAMTPVAVEKHRDFIGRFFGSQAGLEKFARAQQEHVNQTFADYAQKLRSAVLRDTARIERFVTKEKLFRSPKGGIAISLTEQTATEEMPAAGQPVTLFNRKNPDGSAYLAGVYTPDKKKNLAVAFLLRINPDGREAWFKNFSIPVDSASVGDSHTYPGAVAPTQEGCALLLRSAHRTQAASANTFVYITEKGDVKTNQKLRDLFYPRRILYSEKSNSFALALKGTAREESTGTPEKLALLQINVLGEMVWKREIDMIGVFTDLIPVMDGLVAVGNYLVIRDPANREFRTKAAQQECSPFIARLSDRGEYQKLELIDQNTSLFVQRAVKVNDNSINLIAFKEKLDVARGKNFTETDNPVHILTNKNAQVVFVRQ
jgi:hypothetical protein